MRQTLERYIRLALISGIAGLSASQAIAEGDPDGPFDWSCANRDFEAVCDQEACSVSDTFTPMSVTLSATEISVCAYTGCWEGKTDAFRPADRRFQNYHGYALTFSTAPDDMADIAITIDTQTGIATVLIAGSFAHPLHCRAM